MSDDPTQSIHDTMLEQASRKNLLERARSQAFEYLDQVRERAVFPDERALEALAGFDELLPESPQSGEQTLDLLHAVGSPATVAQTGGRYFGFVNGGVIPTAMAARWLADAWDQNAPVFLASPVASKLESVCERWLVELLGLPQATVAGLVTGTSTATLCGLAAARYALLARRGWDIHERGLHSSPRIRVVLSEQAHGSVFKALALLGFGNADIERVSADRQGRLDPGQMPELDDSTLLILQAGNVNTGAFDPFAPILGLAAGSGAWIHVDGAFGLWAAASPAKRHLTKGMEAADSWSADGHKTLNTPYDCGIILCKDAEALTGAMRSGGAYIQYSQCRDGMRFVPDMSRRARAVELWAALRFLGRRGVAELVDGLCQRASEFAGRLRDVGFQVLNDVDFNQVLVACDDPGLTTATLQAVQRSGTCWCGGTEWNGEPAIRISVCSWATTRSDIDKSVESFVAARSQALRQS